MTKPLHMALLLTLLAAAPAGWAQSGQADPALGRQLQGMGYDYEVDADGDYRLVFELEGGRSQLVYVRSPVENYGSLSVREIWSPGFRVKGSPFPAAIADRLLVESERSKLGGWVRQGDMAMFVVKIDAAAGNDQLADAIDAAIRSADELEQEMTLGADEF